MVLIDISLKQNTRQQVNERDRVYLSDVGLEPQVLHPNSELSIYQITRTCLLG